MKLKVVVFSECSGNNTFACLDTTPDEPLCVDELQVCDGTENCPNGFDEPADCHTGYTSSPTHFVS